MIVIYLFIHQAEQPREVTPTSVPTRPLQVRPNRTTPRRKPHSPTQSELLVLKKQHADDTLGDTVSGTLHPYYLN